jgi:hypothetical protein
MKAWGLILSIAALCAGCATPRADVPMGLPDAYVGPSMRAPIDLDRADADIIRGVFEAGRQPDGNAAVFASNDWPIK